MFVIWSFEFLFSGAKNLTERFDIFLSGTLNFSYLDLKKLLIWSFEFLLSGAYNFTYLEL